MTHRHAARLDRVLTHIHRRLDGDLSLDALADVAALSRFHFSRAFRDVTGEGAVEVVRRIRLNRAAILLVVTDLPPDRVARACGYGTLRGFERAFRRAFGYTPLAARAGRRLPIPIVPPKTGDWTMYPVEIRDEAPATLAAYAHRGAYDRIGPVFEHAARSLAEAGIAGGAAIGIYHDNPQEVAVDDLRSHAGQVAETVPDGMERVDIPGGRYAVLTHVGPFSGLPAAWHFLYTVALPERNLAPADGTPFERYPDDMATTPIEKVVTEICVPVRAAG
ncbi:MAG: AraC family transcriptional regulator [Pseudomonadota bacterium]